MLLKGGLESLLGCPGGSDDKGSASNAGNLGSTPGSERSSGEGNGNPPCILAWRILWTDVSDGLSPWGRKESDTTERERTAHSLSYVEPVPPSLLPGM